MQVCLDKLYDVLAQHAHDGTEVHHVVDHELRGLENEAAVTKIKDAIRRKYQNAIPADAAVEIVGKLVELTWDR